MKKLIVYISLIIAGSTLFIYWLNSAGLNQTSNAFTRNIKTHSLKLKHVLQLPDETFAFAGDMDSNVVLNKFSDRINLYKTGFGLKQLDTISIKYPLGFDSTLVNIYKNYFGGFVYCSNPKGDILRYNGKTTVFFKSAAVAFDNFKAISASTLIVRSKYHDDDEINRSLSRLTLSKKVSQEKEYLLAKTKNGLFVNDGRLFYDRKNSIILYMYYYKGEIICLDTNLNKLYISKTIDTVRTPQIKTTLLQEKVKGGRVVSRSLIQKTPPKLVNIYVTTHKSNMYIISRLKADNESSSDFSHNQVIDVYDLSSGKYKSSFYIPKYKRNRLTQFIVKGDLLIAIFGKNLVSYQFIE